MRTVTPESFRAPDWAAGLAVVPPSRIRLAATPTPVEVVSIPTTSVEIRVKRDDATGGVELTGNKTRKLEFLIAAALTQGADLVVTTGGSQSNHCRATVAASARAGLAVHTVLRDDGTASGGNFLLGAVLGARQTVVPRSQWRGHECHLAAAVDEAKATGRRPVAIPCGGSTAVGMWGYILCVDELLTGGHLDGVSHVVCASGSGGTAAGLSVGLYLARRAGALNHDVAVRSYCVCDTPDYFYDIVDALLDEQRGASDDTQSPLAGVKARQIVDFIDAAGRGYGIPSDEELATRQVVARACGMVLDTTYTNKAFSGLLTDIRTKEFAPSGAVLFVHTGGGPSLFAGSSPQAPETSAA
jgi:D-cysteine desulfhydrase